MPFKITSLVFTDHDTSLSAVYPYKITCLIEMPTIDFKKYSNKGALYGIDVCNRLYRFYNVTAYNPQVKEYRASKGVKEIELVFYLRREQATQWLTESVFQYTDLLK